MSLWGFEELADDACADGSSASVIAWLYSSQWRSFEHEAQFLDGALTGLRRKWNVQTAFKQGKIQ